MQMLPELRQKPAVDLVLHVVAVGDCGISQVHRQVFKRRRGQGVVVCCEQDQTLFVKEHSQRRKVGDNQVETEVEFSAEYKKRIGDVALEDIPTLVPGRRQVGLGSHDLNAQRSFSNDRFDYPWPRICLELLFQFLTITAMEAKSHGKT